MTDPWSEVKFWATVLEESKRTVYCAPEWESRVKGVIDAHGLAGLYEVVVNRHLPTDAIFLADHNALEASVRESLQRMVRP